MRNQLAIKTFLFILLSLSLINCREPRIESEEKGFLAEQAMVVSARKEASEIGASIMKKGGNAFDAMIATDLALVVAYPVAGNIGGGGFTVYRTKSGETGALDYREKAPMAAKRDMYLDDQGVFVAGRSTYGALAIGVPGTVAGLFEIHEKFGSLPFSDLIQPAIDLARTGVIVTQKQADRLNHYREHFQPANKRIIFLDRQWTAGDTIKYEMLARTFERIRDNGRAEFYRGKTAELLVEQVRELGGILTMEDLERYKAVWRTPVETDYRGFHIISMPPPSSGGICLAMLLKSIEDFDPGGYEHNSEKYIQLLVEAERRVYADRAYYLGDPDFVEMPVQDLISKSYNKARMANFSWEKATPSSKVSHGEVAILESDQTTHYSIVDPYGNAVSVTNTLNGAYGSKVYVEEAGFFLNNEMDDFSAKPGTPNMFGLLGAEANAIEPEKRMLSSMTPTIVEKDGNLVMVLGSPGGSQIITSVLQNILNVIEFGMGMQESVDKSRFHHQWMPDEVLFEKSFDTTGFGYLRERGYHVMQGDARIIGKVDAILVQPDGTLEGGADPRGDDAAAGF